MTPSSAYLNSLKSSTSRKSVSSNLNSCVKILSNGKITKHDMYDWGSLTYHDVNSILVHLTDLSKSPKTINNYLSAMKGVANNARKMKVITLEEETNIKEIKTISGSHEKKGRALELKELNHLIDHCLYKDDIKSLRDAVIMSLTYGAGLRRSETANLPLSSYDSDKSTIRIKGKGNKVRVLILNARVQDMLESWLDERGRDDGNIFLHIRRGGHVTKEKISAQAIYNVVIQRYKEAGLKRLSPHDLRHTFATQLLANGTDIKIVQELLGHENLESTANYIHSTEDAKKKASKGLPF